MNTIVFIFSLLPCQNLWGFQIDERLMTAPERSAYKKTSTHAEVMSFIEALQAQADFHLETMAVSDGGRKVPLMVLADPVVRTPEEARNSGKPVIYLQGNIHGGEVEGKEALQQLARDILLGDKKHLLEHQIVLIGPIYNSDGNDKMDKNNRRSQEGSPVEAGSRASGGGFDLNRDGVKMEAVETKGLMEGVFLRWDPVLFVDMHTTNGTWHGYSLTYAPNYHTNGDSATTDYLMNTMLPAITKTVEQDHGLHFYLYGGYRLRNGFPPKTWRTYNHHPRYLVNYAGLRNRFAILSETFAHDRFDHRIHSAYVFASEILAYTHRHGHQLAAIAQKADRDSAAFAAQNAGKVKRGVRFKMAPLDEPFTLRTYRYKAYQKDGQSRYFRTGEIIDVPGVANYSRFEAEVEATVPMGYLFPAEYSAVADKLKQHGVVVSVLEKAVKASGDVFLPSGFQKRERMFEGHHLATVSGNFQRIDKEFPAGTYHVDLAQPLAFLVFYLLEPQSDDGLVTWNFFDSDLSKEEPAYPVFKYFKIED